MKIEVFDFETKKSISDVELSPDVFSLKFDNSFISMHFSRMKKAHHIKTNKTKHIGEISGTTRKPYKQKHTGNARQGSLRSAQFRGGGIAFGPRGIQRNIKIPKSEVNLAKSMILSTALASGSLFVVSNINLSSHKTKSAKKVIKQFSENAKKVLIVHAKNVTSNSLLAVRNVEGFHYSDISMLTTFDLMNANLIILDVSCVEALNNNLLV